MFGIPFIPFDSLREVAILLTIGISIAILGRILSLILEHKRKLEIFATIRYMRGQEEVS
jgi:hypothetical protein